ncbi:MAG TPA: MTAP family purine nucleoside phosphorylase [Methanomethylovorans sp.]|nr:MTAP family purine nucleoside phosphorylase [Methanomethylovorans sp.]
MPLSILDKECTSNVHFSFAVIGGVGFSHLDDRSQITVNTEYGAVQASIARMAGINVLFIPRHTGSSGHVPPHRINYRANIMAIKQLGITRVVAVNSVGTIHGHPIGSMVLPYDFVDFTCMRPSTFFEDQTVHADMSEPYCPQLRSLIRSILKEKGVQTADVIYACTEGPRFETKAEIRMLSSFADVVGMTGLPEVVLAKEMQLCYASLCLVTNMASGIESARPTATEVLDILTSRKEFIFELLHSIAARMPIDRECMCNNAIDNGTL